MLWSGALRALLAVLRSDQVRASSAVASQFPLPLDARRSILRPVGLLPDFPELCRSEEGEQSPLQPTQPGLAARQVNSIAHNSMIDSVRYTCTVTSATSRIDAADLDDPLALDRQVCFALAVASRSVIALYRPVLEPLGLTHPQHLVMVALWQHDSLTVRELGMLLQLDPGTLSAVEAPRLRGTDHQAAACARRALSDGQARARGSGSSRTRGARSSRSRATSGHGRPRVDESARGTDARHCCRDRRG